MRKKSICSAFSVLVLVPVLSSVVEAADPSLVGYWRFDEGSGTIAFDSSGNDYHGTITGAEWVTGQLGGALNFKSVGYVTVPPEAWASVEKQVTIAFWAYGDPDVQPQGDSCFGAWQDAANNKTRVAQCHLPWANSVIYWDSGGDAVGYDRIGKAATPEEYEGSWQHWAFTKDVDAGGEKNIFLNGILWASSTGKASPMTGVTVFKIGSMANGQLNYGGMIDDFQLYNRALRGPEIQQAMTGVIVSLPALASNPSPADGATDVIRDVVLSWTPGEYAPAINGHKVYLSENFDDVSDGIAVIGTQDANSYDPGRLDLGTTYYWRVDEANSVSGWDQGNVWQFTVEPLGYPVPDTSITATASSSNSAAEGPGNTINGSGLGDDDLHSAANTDMWLSSMTGTQPTWIQYEFDRVYKLHQISVWNYNSYVEPLVGFGIKEATIEYSVDGTDWTTLGTTHEFARASGADGHASDTTVDLGDVAVKYVKIIANSNWGGVVFQYGLSEIRFFFIPVCAREPVPDSGATDVSIGTIDEPTDTTLGFRAGREAAVHNVYLSTDEQAVIDGAAPVSSVTEVSYGPLPLDIGQTYYWRVDEVNDVETPRTWEGDIWSFATQEYFVLDDFEDYNDYPPDEIFGTWGDGYDDPVNGSLIANPSPPFAETSVVHGGTQAMPYSYDNSVGYSEATMTLNSLRRDWTIRGIGSLSLWFRGYPAFVGSFVEAPAGTYTMTASGADIWGTSDEFHFAYKELSGSGAIIAKVESVEKTHNWAKAGVMIRDTLEPDSAHAMIFATPDLGLAFERRAAAGESTSRTREAGVNAPQWVMVERDIGGGVRVSYSADGIEWTEIGRELINMSTHVYIGLVLTAHNVHATCEAKFSNVQITGAVSPQWANQDIGILSNDPEPMYVALANTTGTPAAVYHPDPNATQEGSWTEWNIDLKRFADQGVNLDDVDTLSIGFGDKVNPHAGTSGKMYFDDIRLYPLREPKADLTDN